MSGQGEDQVKTLKTMFGGSDISESVISTVLAANEGKFDDTVNTLLNMAADTTPIQARPSPNSPARPQLGQPAPATRPTVQPQPQVQPRPVQPVVQPQPQPRPIAQAQPQPQPPVQTNSVNRENLATLQGMFGGDITQSVIQTVLDSNQGNIENAIDSLLNMASKDLDPHHDQPAIAIPAVAGPSREEIERLEAEKRRIEEERRRFDEWKRLQDKMREDEKKAREVAAEKMRREREAEAVKRQAEDEKRKKEEEDRKSIEEGARRMRLELEHMEKERKKAEDERKQREAEAAAFELQLKRLREAQIEQERRLQAEEQKRRAALAEEERRRREELEHLERVRRSAEEERTRREQSEIERTRRQELLRLEEQQRQVRMAEERLRAEEMRLRAEKEERERQEAVERERRTQEEQRLMREREELFRLKEEQLRREIEERERLRREFEEKIRLEDEARKQREVEAKRQREEEDRLRLLREEEEAARRIEAEKQRREQQLAEENERKKKHAEDLSSSVFVKTTTEDACSITAEVVGDVKNEVQVVWKLEGAATTSDWIGLYPTHQPNNRKYTVSNYTNGIGEGAHTFKALKPGIYEARFFRARAYEPFTKSNAVRIGPEVTLNAQVQGDLVVVQWTCNPPSAYPTYDWIGLYEKEKRNKKYLATAYCNASGYLTFRAPITPGVYDVRFFAYESHYNDQARAEFIVENRDEFIAAPPQVAPGAQLLVNWSINSLQTSASDWIGLFAVDNLNNKNYIEFKYVLGNSLEFHAPSTPGVYEFRYFSVSVGKYTTYKTSNRVTVVASSE